MADMFAVKTAASQEEVKEMSICASGGDDDNDGEKKSLEVQGDGDGMSFNTTLWIRMQARFKPRLKANKEMKKIPAPEFPKSRSYSLSSGPLLQTVCAIFYGSWHSRQV